MKRFDWLAFCACSLVAACSGGDDSQGDASAGSGGTGGVLADASATTARDASGAAIDATSASETAAAADATTGTDAHPTADSSITGDELAVGDSSNLTDGAGAESAVETDGGFSGELDGTARGEASIDLGSLRDSGGGLIDPNMVPPRPPTF